MSFPTDFTQSDNRSRQRSGANQRTSTYTSNYTLPTIDMSALGLESFEDARCATCDGELNPKHTDPLGHILPELCLDCQNQVVFLRIERENIKKEQRRRQMEAVQAAHTQELAQAELRRVLVDGNRKLKEEIEEIRAQIAAQEVRSGELRRRREAERRLRRR
ncbi:hypothetical protein EYC80_009502 [Monilinia laxa]|uniref:Uncharacterized protein n=1 Tax=Monilinia laxa TaxID=61186 RepID=A0A5N6JY13_MONLA|nr:hypothetical protein EYC80_009502 [Monilinia laxa]